MARNPDFDDDEGSAKRPGSPVDVMRLLRVIWRGRRLLVLAAMVGTVVGVAIANFLIKDTYETIGSVLYVGVPGSEGNVSQEFDAAAGAAVSDRFYTELRERVGMDDMPLPAMRGFVTVSSDSRSAVVVFTGTSEKAREASAFANAAIDVFVDKAKERRGRQLRSERVSLQGRIEIATEELSDAQEAYSSFREEHGITDVLEGDNSVLVEIRTDANLAAVAVDQKEAEIAQLEAQLATLPETITGTGMVGSNARITELRERLAEARGRGLGELNPMVQSLKNQLAALEAAGTSRISRNPAYVRAERALAQAKAELEPLKQRAASLEALADEEQGRQGAASQVQTEAAALLASVKVKEELLERLAAHSATVEDQLLNVPSGVRVVSRAQPPELPVPSKRKKLTAVGIPAMLVFFSVLFLLARDLRRLRLVSSREIAWWGNGPVVGASTWPRRQSAIHELVTDLHELLSGARGSLLVVGMNDRDVHCARRLLMEMGNEVDMFDDEFIEDPRHAGLKGPELARTRPAGSPAHRERRGPELSGSSIVLRSTGPSRGSQRVRPTEVAPGGTLIDHKLEISVFDSHGGAASIRTAARRADGVLMVVSSGVSGPELSKFRKRLGVENVAFVVVNVPTEAENDPDRTGPVGEFLEIFAA
ncbi:MAG: Wzz/FepE/Etk N-terminal domain-containing protein [Myxococcota bacterium]